MLASETRQHAREALQGKWGKAALTMFVYSLLTGLISIVLKLIPIIGPIVQLVIEIPLTFGLIATLIKLRRGENTTYTEFFTNGFNNFAGSWKVALWTCVKLLLPIILICVSITIIMFGFGAAAFSVVSSDAYVTGSISSMSDATKAAAGSSAIVGFIGVIALIASSIWFTIRSYLFKPVFFLLFDNPNKTAKEVVEESANVMKGNRWKWFCLEFSFIGWLILAGFTFGIAMLWLTPYILIAQVVFYEFLFGKKGNTVEATAEPTQETIEEPKVED